MKVGTIEPRKGHQLVFKAFEELNIKTVNPLNLEGYMEKLENLKEKTGIDEAVLCGIRQNKFRRSSYLRYGR